MIGSIYDQILILTNRQVVLMGLKTDYIQGGPMKSFVLFQKKLFLNFGVMIMIQISEVALKCTKLYENTLCPTSKLDVMSLRI